MGAAGDHADLGAAVMHRVAVAGDGAVEHFEADNLPGDALGLLAHQHVAADELALVPADNPAQITLHDRAGLVHVVAVQAHGGFEAQRVARPQAGGHQPVGLPRFEQRVPQLRGELRRHKNLEAVFAGVAGARHRGPYAGHFPVREPVVLHAGEIDGRERLHDAQGLGPLHGDERVAGARIDDRDLAHCRRVRGDPGVVLLDVRGIDDQQVVAIGEAVDEHVVDEGALGCGERRVLRLSVFQLRGVVGDDVLHRRQGVGPGQLNLPHVRHVEQAGGGAHGQMFGRDAAVFHGHVPATVRHHAGAEGDVSGVQGSLLQRGVADVTHGQAVSSAAIRPNVLRPRTPVKDRTGVETPHATWFSTSRADRPAAP